MEHKIYQSFLDKVGDDWFEPWNNVNFMSYGEFHLSDHLWQMNLLERKKVKNVWKFKKK